MRFTIFSEASGRVLRSGTCPVEMVALQAREAEVAIAGDWSADDYYLDAAGVQPLPPKPSPDHAWDIATLAWTAPLADLKARKLSELKRERDRRLEDGFTWDGSTFDSDSAVSQPRLLGAFSTAIAGGWPLEGQPWRLADNTWRTLSAADAIAVWGAFQAHMAGIFAAFQAKEAAVLAMTDEADVLAYDTAVGW